MNDLFIAMAIAEVAVIVLLLIRLAVGPSVSDRVVAVNVICTQCALSTLFFSAFADRTVYLDVALWFASFSYLGAFVWARYLERGLL